jgi:hypothetical protein
LPIDLDLGGNITFSKNISELLEVSSDQSLCEVAETLENPLQSIALEQFNYVAFEGNIGQENNFSD